MWLTTERLAVLLLFSTQSISGVNAAPAPQVSNSAVASITANPTACASVASATDSLLEESPRATPTIPATLAIECLQSVPNKAEPAQRLIRSLKAFAQWQSTLAWLKNPPRTYPFPAVDIIGGLDDIASRAAAGGFNSEYDFQLAIVQLITSTHDGHFSYYPDIFRAFSFRNGLAMDLVSVSVDGIEVPKLYHASELFGNDTRNGTASGRFPRAIVMINGEDAATVVERRNLVFSGFQDADAQWNSVMENYASLGATTYVAASIDYNGPSLTFTYDNGDERTEDSVAVIRRGADFTGVETGEDFYDRFCDPDGSSGAFGAASATETTTTTTSPSTPAPTIPGYPFPVIRDSGAGTTSGYFLNDTGYDDTAVLAISAFSPAADTDSTDYLTDFQETIEDFLAECRRENKKRLVIDLTANGGGFISAGYELFAQLFPDEPMFRADNIRAPESLRQIADTVESVFDEIVSGPSDDAPAERIAALRTLVRSTVVSNLLPFGVYAPDGSAYTSVSSILGPVTLNNDTFTAYQFMPLNETSSFFNMTGTGHRSSPPPAVFQPEDVVLLTDGTCGSTCTLFSYLMLFQLNVKTVSIGGRPRTGAMQSVAGVEGAQIFYMNEISAAAAAAIYLNPDGLNDTGSEIAELAEGYALRRAFDPEQPGAVNGRNAFSRTNSETPLQFLYQPANCRVFYTREMIYGPAEVWKRAVDATWTDPERFCVEGSRVDWEDLAGQETDTRFTGGGEVPDETGEDIGNSNTNLDDDSGAGSLRIGSTIRWAVGLMVVMMWFGL
ncbi:Tail specific protease domain-containing protein [Madurella fahalii]|uniref:Tail specific protease domain-containing protein n=1 Tax=Madurella fahalii TaxID=1157608 RepID=A0ABQ0GL37_9PEZI